MLYIFCTYIPFNLAKKLSRGTKTAITNTTVIRIQDSDKLSRSRIPLDSQVYTIQELGVYVYTLELFNYDTALKLVA